MIASTISAKLDIFPKTASITPQGHLAVGGCDLVELAARFGTPLYLFDEVTLREQCREFRREFESRYPETTVLYAAKAYLNTGLASIFLEEGLGLDVVSGGEISIAQRARFPMSRLYFHGNNKTPEELDYALSLGVGCVVVDNFYELRLLDEMATARGMRTRTLLRVSPGIDAHTHAKTTTGVLDSKFGFPIATGQAEEAVRFACAASGLDLAGVHFHLGSPIFELEPYVAALEVVLSFAKEMVARHGLKLAELSPGGGFAVQYVRGAPAPPISAYAETIVGALLRLCHSLGLGRPRLLVEPGRAIVGRAGVALYRVGASKEIPGLRKYVAVDGGMGDNIRPILYGSHYEALAANKAAAEETELVTLAGKYCESGDVLVRDCLMPPLEPGDLVALPAAGAYCLAMASNYNAALRPPIVLVREGKARLLRRRETYEDLARCDVTP